jgi:pilus assembly protein Flp/PilA
MERVEPDLLYKGWAGSRQFPLNHNSRRESNMQNLLKRLWQDEEGQDLVEYALLLVLIALAAAATIKTLGTSINAVFTNANTALTSYTT